MIVYHEDPEHCGLKVGDTLKFKDNFRPLVIVNCGGNLDEWVDA